MIFPREYAEWSDFWWEKAGDFSRHRILLIGDSVTRSYRGRVQEIYRPQKIAVDQLCGSRCAGDPVLTAELDLATGALNGYTYDIIHFNNGLHGGCNDTQIPLSVYEEGIRDILRVLKKNQPNAKIIVAASTPTDHGNGGAYVIERNEALRRIAEENGCLYHDLYTLTCDAEQFPQPDGIHFEKEAARKLGEHVAAYLSNFLPFSS